MLTALIFLENNRLVKKASQLQLCLAFLEGLPHMRPN